VNKLKFYLCKFIPYIIGGLLFLFFISLYFRNSSLYPIVIDEYFYNKFSRLEPLSFAHYPNYLYYLIYRATNSCGDAFWSCVQFLNSIFYVAAFFPIYGITKKVCNQNTALFIGLFSIIAPFNYFTAFFMVEAAYFFIFWVSIWALLEINQKTLIVQWCLMGFLYGVSMLIKVNSVLILPAYLIYLIYAGYENQSNKNAKNLFIRLGLFTIFAFGTKFIFSWLVAGNNGLTILGSMYSDSVEAATKLVSTEAVPAGIGPEIQSLTTNNSFIKNSKLLIYAFSVNLLPLLFIFSVPIASTIYFLKINFFKKAIEAGHTSSNKIYLITTIFIGNLIVVTSLFNWFLVRLSSGEIYPMRRYYEFAFPLFLICASASLSLLRDKDRLGLKFAIGSLSALVVLCLLFFKSIPYWVSDWFSEKPFVFYCLGIAVFINLCIWIYKIRWGNYLFLFIVFPMIAIYSNIGMDVFLKNTRSQPADNDKVGIFIRNYLGAKDISELVVASVKPQPNLLFYFDNPAITTQELIPNGIYDLSMMPPNKSRVLLLGDYPIAQNALEQTHMDYLPLGNATLYGGHGNFILDFRKNDWPEYVIKIDGFDYPESWGAWSIAKKIRLEFKHPLPRKFNLKINARAFSKNSNQELILKVGNFKTQFKLNDNYSEEVIAINNYEKSSILEITIPAPTAPATLGIGQDERQLGIGVKSMEFIW